jgi:pimeloyl-ACP methyl ester carboxylesterase
LKNLTKGKTLNTINLKGRDDLHLVADTFGACDDPPVLLLHGGGQTRHSWHGTAQRLVPNGWRVYAVDLRGHGDSEWPPDGDYSLDAFAADVASIASVMDQPPVIIGASLGGIASLIAIGESPVALAHALVLVDVAPHIEQEGADRIGAFMRSGADLGFASLEEAADAVAAYNPNRKRPQNLSGLEKNLRQRPDGRWVWHWDPRFLGGLRGGQGSDDETRTTVLQADRLDAAARALSLPVLLVRGGASDLLSEKGAAQFAALVPSAQTIKVEGAGHMVAGDRNDDFSEGIVNFLNHVRSGNPADKSGTRAV